MRKKSKQPLFLETDTLETIWASSAYACRILGAYNKYDVEPMESLDSGFTYVTDGSVANARLAHYAVQYPEIMKPKDYLIGQDMRNHYKGLIFKGLQKQLTNFERSLVKVVEREDWATGVEDRLHFAILCSSARGYFRDIKRQAVQDRITNYKGKHLGSIKERLDLNIQVVKSVYSRNYECHFITAVTADEDIVFFSYKSELPEDSKHNIKGTVKAHRDNKQTQLNRVKVIKEL